VQAIKDKDKNLIYELNDEFFSYIPHDFGFQRMEYHLIDTDDKVKKKLDML
jgi:poly [ADP-ribose] polymerase